MQLKQITFRSKKKKKLKYFLTCVDKPLPSVLRLYKSQMETEFKNVVINEFTNLGMEKM